MEVKKNNENIRQMAGGYSRGISSLEFGKFYKDHTNAACVRVGEDDLWTTTEFTAVSASDIGSDYVAGCEGKVKSIKEYRTDIETPDMAKLTTFYYQDAEFPKFVTKIVVTAIPVV
jgi:hypothetical protein